MTGRTGDGVEDRRGFLRSAAGAGLSGYLLAHAAPGEAADPPPMPAGTGTAGAGPERPTIAMLVYPHMIMQDLVGPLTVFNLMRCEIHLVWKDHTPVATETGLTVAPTTLLADCPPAPDVLFVPGGLEGTTACIEDPELLDFLRRRGAAARWVTSDCTGSLLLGAAGLLRGYRAASHWSVIDQLSIFGATPTRQRVVRDRNRLTGGGVTAGIDLALTLAGLMRGQAQAEAIQLVIEYAPAPPFAAGSPDTAPRAIVEEVRQRRAPAIGKARAAGLRAAARLAPS